MMLLAVLVLLDGGWTVAKPDALLAFEQARKSILFADVRWWQVSPRSRLSRGEKVHLRSFLARDEVAHFIIGTDAGVPAWTEDGEAIKQGPKAFLLDSDGWWIYDMDKPFVSRWIGSPDVLMVSHVQSIGMTPSLRLQDAPHEALRSAVRGGKGGVTYEQKRIGKAFRVTARYGKDGEENVVWYIDPRQGWNATRCEYRLRGKLVRQSETSYELTNGVFVPVTCAYMNAAGDISIMIGVDSFEVNSPDLPTDLYPEHIGIEPGMPVFVQNDPAVKRQHLYAGLGKSYETGKVLHMIREGEIEEGARVGSFRDLGVMDSEIPDPKQVRREIEALRAELHDASLDDWEQYTVDFVRRYDLDDHQRQKAVQILRQCQARRDRYRILKRAEIHQARALMNASEKADRDLGRTKVEALEAPVVRIFEETLKLRLNQLPTRAQRASAEKRETSTAPKTTSP